VEQMIDVVKFALLKERVIDPIDFSIIRKEIRDSPVMIAKGKKRR
ncbi:MAG: hypothetical protein H0W84_13145, partial [Bacteroidetes bacterium]|nr:hypothetical protein [Bacteroidota bacterium]